MDAACDESGTGIALEHNPLEVIFLGQYSYDLLKLQLDEARSQADEAKEGCLNTDSCNGKDSIALQKRLILIHFVEYGVCESETDSEKGRQSQDDDGADEALWHVAQIDAAAKQSQIKGSSQKIEDEGRGNE